MSKAGRWTLEHTSQTLHPYPHQLINQLSKPPYIHTYKVSKCQTNQRPKTTTKATPTKESRPTQPKRKTRGAGAGNPKPQRADTQFSAGGTPFKY